MDALNSLPQVKALLQDGVDKGYWTLSDLDRPTTSWVSNTRVDRRFFKDGYQGVAHRNLLRDGVDSPGGPANSPELEPGVELDGVTLITNATTTDDIPF